MNDGLESTGERRRRQLAEIVEHLYANNRTEFARDLGVSSSLISMMLRGEREVSDRFALHLVWKLQDLLNNKAYQLYHARDVALEFGRDTVPGFDLPLIMSNADHLEAIDAAAHGEADDPETMAEITDIMDRESGMKP